jgi:hypothetical protein
MKIGRIVQFYLRFIYGAGSAVGTSPRFTLPVTAASYYLGGNDECGRAIITDIGVANYDGACTYFDATSAQIIVWNAAGTFLTANSITSTVPMTWNAPDQIVVTGRYEAAT